MKSRQEMIVMANVIRSQADALHNDEVSDNCSDDVDAETNESINEMVCLYQSLYCAAGNREFKNKEVKKWINEENSVINDFLL